MGIIYKRKTSLPRFESFYRILGDETGYIVDKVKVISCTPYNVTYRNGIEYHRTVPLTNIFASVASYIEHNNTISITSPERYKHSRYVVMYVKSFSKKDLKLIDTMIYNNRIEYMARKLRIINDNYNKARAKYEREKQKCILECYQMGLKYVDVIDTIEE